MIHPHPNKAIRIFYPDALWRVKTNKKALYLTFDDGPTPGITEKILRLLTQFDAKATFFCLGSNAENNIDLFDAIKKSGHSIGNHSYAHPKGRKTKNTNYFYDIDKSNKIIGSNLFRPPYGSLKLNQYKYLKKYYKIVFWDIMAYDFHPKVDADKCFQITKRFAKPGSIIVFHDNEKASETMLPALEKTLEYFSSEGFVFKNLEIACG